MKTSKFWVVTVISNTARYKSRYELYKKFEQMVKDSGANLFTVEVAFGDRPFEITQFGNPNHLQMRTFDELWHKENMINLGVQRLPAEAEYIAWIDADISFTRPDWLIETVQQLQHFQVVQMFQTAVDLGPDNEAFQIHQGFMYSYVTGKPRGPGYAHFHPGYSWAMRKEAWDMLGGLYDVSMLGSGDHLMANAMIGIDTLPETMSQDYRDSLTDWMNRCTRLLHRDVGFVSGTILHYWHGSKPNRKYKSRWKILEEAQFSPFLDIKRDHQGLYSFDMDGSDRMIKFRDEVRRYFASRREDARYINE